MAAPISMSDSERQLIEAQSQGQTGPTGPTRRNTTKPADVPRVFASNSAPGVV